jgi:diguanylate cyclase (GGDEF)-like protein
MAMALLASSAVQGSEELDRLNALLPENPEMARQQASELLNKAQSENDSQTAGEAAALMARALSRLGEREQAAEAFEQATEYLLQQADPDPAMAVMSELSRLRFGQGRYEAAKAVERRILSLATEHSLKDRRAHALSNLGVLNKRTGELDAALDFYQQALAIRREIGDRLGESQTLNNIGIMYKNWGDFFLALQCQLEALEIKREVGESGDVAQTLGNMALIYRELDDHEHALLYQTEAMALLADSKRPGHVIHAQANLAHTYIMLDRLDEAEPHLQQAIDGARTNQLVPHLANSLLSRARLEMKRENVNAAQATLGEIRPLMEKMNDPRFTTDLLLLSTEVERQAGNLEIAISHLEQARSLASELSNQSQLRRVLALLATVNSEMGRDDLAFESLRQSVAIEEQLKSGVSARRLADQHAEMLKQQSDAGMALLSRDNQIAALQLSRQQQKVTALFAVLALTLVVVGLQFSRHRFQKRAREVLEQRNIRIQEQNAELEEKADALFSAATTDSLTGLFNRQHAIEQANSLLAACIEQDCDLAVLMLDMDHFKAVNDSHSHMAGDAVLRFASDAMRSFFGDEAILGRFGGEEFIIVLFDNPLALTRQKAEDLRAHFESEKMQYGDELLGVTVSIGICDRRSSGSDDLQRLIHDADQALYLAKREGRNQVKVCVQAA